jgi:FAD/FMN-containing dehydrogenase
MERSAPNTPLMTNASTTSVSATDVAKLRAAFRGALLHEGEEGYDETRRVWNGDIDRRPSLIARCAGADDVATAVRFCRRHGLPATVRGGGHAVAGHAVADGAVMIDLSLMRGVAVDHQARTVRAAGGCLWSDVDKATQQYALATTGGIISHTGVGGLTLGGGLGHLMRRAGLTVDNLLAVDLVTAEGERRRVDDTTDPDLFWAVRGGGGNFGVATTLHFRLHQVGPMVLAGPVFWPLAQAPDVLGAVRDLAEHAPDELGITFVTMLAPPMPFLPAEQYGRPVLGTVLVWSGDMATGQHVLEPLRRTGRPLADVVRPVPYLAVQSMLDGGALHGRHYYWKSHRLPKLTDDAVEVIVSHAEAITSPFSQIGGWVIGGAVSRVADDTTAVGEREPGYDINVTGAWSPLDGEPDRHRTWVRTGWDALQPHASGVYANFISDEGSDGVRAAYGARLARLTTVKDRVDPDNFFRYNANIIPSTAGAA